MATKIGFIGIINNPSSSLNSHSAGWNHLIRRSISEDAVILSERDEWNDYDMLIINHGPNFRTDVFNVIGGIGDAIHLRIHKLIEYKGDLRQIDGFQLKHFLKMRKVEGYVFDKYICGITLPEKEGGVLVGDSHAISVWPDSDWKIDRRDGKTLYGFLKNPSYADMLYFGNIDIRFHLGRQPDPHQATHELVTKYIAYARSIGAIVTCLLPVESETRKLPGTGLYKTKPFFGTRELRSELVDLFNQTLKQSGLRYHEWPKAWYSDIKFYEDEVMEPRQSVHIRPKYYVTHQR
jgi:hypothetical protein